MIDFEKLKTIYQIGKDLEAQDIYSLIKSAKNKTYAPSEYLIEEGTKRRDIFYLKKGLIRSFIVNEKGDEITMGLKWENHVVASPDIILHGQASRFYFQALEHTDVLLMDYDLLQNIISKNPKLEKSRKYIFQRMLKEAQERIESFVLYSPEERYIRYIESNPELINRVPNKYIANVLGITPVSLSRIRKRLATKK